MGMGVCSLGPDGRRLLWFPACRAASLSKGIEAAGNNLMEDALEQAQFVAGVFGHAVRRPGRIQGQLDVGRADPVEAAQHVAHFL